MGKKGSYIEIGEEVENPYIDSKSEKRIQKKRKKKISKVKIYLIVILIASLYIFFSEITQLITMFMTQNPKIYYIYSHIESQMINYTYLGLFYVASLGSLFFLAIPSEAIFVYYLSNSEKTTLILLIIITIGNSLGLLFNYIIGFLIGKRPLQYFFQDNFEKYKKLIDKYGSIVLLIGNIIPGPIEVLSVFYGGFKYDIKKYIIFSFLGRLIKYFILLVLFIFFWDSILEFYSEIIESFLFI